ncbi:TetR/AcrR family transcriptional regulator [Gordonia aichiensis]|uniref:TetR/AcrR family transcriptional regulator n=1 Tax=Gordonia aichiensis TaxID=36820 RepID=UPI0032674AE0
MRRNSHRRATLVDAAIEVLAEQGARGLTFRAIDAAAEVPPGTASNYFAGRDDLLGHIAARVYERIRPDEESIARQLVGEQDRDHLVTVMRAAVRRISEFRSGYLALLELRLEATRRPEIRAVLTRDVRKDIDDNVSAHQASDFPGDATSVRLLHLALNWLIVERLTLPDVFSEEEAEELIGDAVERLT